MEKSKKTAIGLTLGCRLNQTDTALLFGRLEGAGYEIIKPGKNITPDLIIINTCTVTANAAQKSRQTARHFKRKYPEACLIVTGCDCDKALAEWEKEDFVDLALPNREKKNIPEIVEHWRKNKQDKHQISPPAPIEDSIFREDTFAEYPFKSRAFLKVQEGCNAFCTYCIVPYVRGPERSRAFSEVIDEACKFIEAGHQEIVITGVNISTYRDHDYHITDILEKIIAIPGYFRIRLGSLEPHVENKNLVELIKHNKKVCRFLHLPLQHGSDSILAKMGRNYSAAEFADFTNFAIAEIPGLHLGTDVIVGFPGETEALFMDSVNFIQKIPFANIHIFRFSSREGTPAAKFPNQVPQQIVKRRAEVISNIAESCKKQFAATQIGKTLPVLIEKETAPGVFEGWSDNYLRIVLSENNLHVGEIVTRKISPANYLSF